MKLIKELNIVLPGDIYPTLLAVGIDVAGQVAEAAIQAGCVEGEESEAWAAKSLDDQRIAVEAELLELGNVADLALKAVAAKQAELNAMSDVPATKGKSAK